MGGVEKSCSEATMLGTSVAFRNLILTLGGEEDDEQQQDQAED